VKIKTKNKIFKMQKQMCAALVVAYKQSHIQCDSKISSLRFSKSTTTTIVHVVNTHDNAGLAEAMMKIILQPKSISKLQNEL